MKTEEDSKERREIEELKERQEEQEIETEQEIWTDLHTRKQLIRVWRLGERERTDRTER